jgi:hypothetical protein
VEKRNTLLELHSAIGGIALSVERNMNGGQVLVLVALKKRKRCDEYGKKR